MTTKKSLLVTVSLILIITIILTGCATILKGTSESVSFNSDPGAAKVYVNGVLMGSTPLQLKLESKKVYNVEFKKDGYEPQTLMITNSVSAGYVVVDILFGLFPVIIDAATGAWYSLDQDNLNANLEPKTK